MEINSVDDLLNVVGELIKENDIDDIIVELSPDLYILTFANDNSYISNDKGVKELLITTNHGTTRVIRADHTWIGTKKQRQWENEIKDLIND